MILVDIAVWIDHLRNGDSTLVNLLNTGRVLAHPFVLTPGALLWTQDKHLCTAANQLGLLTALGHLNMGTITNLGKAYKQYPNRWSRLVKWLVPLANPAISSNGYCRMSVEETSGLMQDPLDSVAKISFNY